MLTTLQALCALPGVSGREDAVREFLLTALAQSPVTSAVTVDPLGNIIARITGKARPQKSLALCAHMDEVGLMITGITEEGYLRFTPVGSISNTVLFGRRVSVNGHIGVIGGKAVHQCDENEKAAAPKTDTLLIDLGAASREEALTVASPGDVALFCDEAVPLGRKLKAKAIDDRGGCAALLSLLNETPPYDLTLLFTVQEEVGLIGAKTAGFAAAPDYAVVVDSTTAADTAGVPADKEVCRQGKGGVLSCIDRATVYDRELFLRIRQEAQEAHIPLQIKEAATGGNDAGSLQCAGTGIKVAALSLPCRYIHSPACVLDSADFEALCALLRRLCRCLPEGV